MVERGDLDHAVDQTPQRHRQRRGVGAPVVRVGDDDHVGGQRVAVGRKQSGERGRTGFLFALDEHRHADGRPAAMCPKGRQMRCDTGLVVGAAAAVEPPVTFGGLERRRRPLAAVALGLHVVMGIQQHGRRAGRRGMARDDRGRSPSLTICTSPKPACDNRSATAWALRCTSGVGRDRPTPIRCAPGLPGRAAPTGAPRGRGQPDRSCLPPTHAPSSVGARYEDRREFAQRTHTQRQREEPTSSPGSPRRQRCPPRASTTRE